MFALCIVMFDNRNHWKETCHLLRYEENAVSLAFILRQSIMTFLLTVKLTFKAIPAHCLLLSANTNRLYLHTPTVPPQHFFSMYLQEVWTNMWISIINGWSYSLNTDIYLNHLSINLCITCSTCLSAGKKMKAVLFNMKWMALSPISESCCRSSGSSEIGPLVDHLSRQTDRWPAGRTYLLAPGPHRQTDQGWNWKLFTSASCKMNTHKQACCVTDVHTINTHTRWNAILCPCRVIS